MESPVLCPHCGCRLLDADASIKTIAREITNLDSNARYTKKYADYYIKCWKCKSKIGIEKET